MLLPFSGRFVFIIGLAAMLCSAQPVTYTIKTIAGNGTSGFSGDSGAATGAELAGPYSVALGSGNTIYIADQANHRIRQVSSSGTITTVAGNGTAGYTGDGSGATGAELNAPLGIAVDSSGNLYIADTANAVVRKVTSGGTISTIAGSNSAGPGYSGEGAATGNQLFAPSAVIVDSSGNVYISDTGNSRIRKVSGGNISTIAGNGIPGYGGDSGLATNAEINGPIGLALDSAANLYIADTSNNRIRMVRTDGTIVTVAGTGTAGFSGDGGLATSAKLNHPLGVAVDSAGAIYIVDDFNARIRKVGSNGFISTIAGDGSFGYLGDGGPATSAQLRFPTGVAVDTAGNVYVADDQNNVVRLLTASAPPPTIGPPVINPGGVATAGGYGGSTTIAPGTWIEIFGTNLAVDSRPWATADFTGNTAPTSLDRTTVTIDGQPAFIEFISSGQIDAQVPSNIGIGVVQLVVTTPGGSSAPYSVAVNSAQPGLLAPANFKVGSTQYVVARFLDNVTFVAPAGAIPGVPSRPAKPGETVVLYGIGFGPVTPNTPAGQIVQDDNALTLPLVLSFGDTPATLGYTGLAPFAVGLYQFNVTVPDVPTSDAIPLTFTLNGQSGTQTLYIAVQNQ